MSMNTSVTMVLTDNSLHMFFVLPHNSCQDNVPSPGGDCITIRELSYCNVATIRFSRYFDRNKYLQKLRELSDVLKRENIVTKSDTFMMQYNPWWVLAVIRRNEVAIEVE